jgi:20S proteasome alpha/beta subunit
MLPRPKPKSREKHHVTIVAGFKCYEGVVLCADTQETVAELSKRNIPKLIFEPRDQIGKTRALNDDDLAVAFCGAANNGPFVDKLVQNAWEDAQMATNLDEVCTIIETSIGRTYRKYGEIYQTGYCPSAELIYGVKMFGGSKLFSASGPVVTEQSRYATGGGGYYMADFLASRMYSHHMSLRQCAILAAYILFQAKEHVDGCGGESQIAVIRNHGVSGTADVPSVERLNRLLGKFDSAIGELILSATDLETEDHSLSVSIDFLKDYLLKCRDEEKPNHKRFSTFGFFAEQIGVMRPEGEIDEFGLPLPKKPNESSTPSDSQKSDGEA